MLKRALNKTLGFSYAQTLKLLRTSKFAQGREFTSSSCARCKTTEDEVTKKFSSDAKTEEKQPVLKKSHDPYVIEENDQEVVDDLKKGNIFYPYKDFTDRTTSIIKEDLKIGGRNLLYYITSVKVGETEHKYFPRHTDILILGNGPIGLMVAYQIKNRFPFGPNVIVVDRNPNFPHESTNLGQGTLMQQSFTEKEEIAMSQYCAEFLSAYHRNTEVDGHPQFSVPYEPLGGLLLADETNAETLMKKSDVLKSCGVHHKIADAEKLSKKFPWLNLDGVLFGSLGMANEGLFDPWAFLVGLKCKAINLGVNFVTAEVVDIAGSGNVPVRLICRLPDGTYNSIDFCYLVIAAGMETTKITELIGKADFTPVKVKLPLEERKRYEYCFYNPDGPGLDTPIVVDTDGTYFRREGLRGHYVAGVPSVPSNDDPQNGIYEVFNNKVKPFLMKRIPKFEKLDIINGWVDTYDTNTANEVGIIGPYPGEPRIILANGFSHVGLQYVPAVGRAVMEYMFYDVYKTIDFKRFEIENLYQRQHLEAEERKKKLLESQSRVAISD